MSAASDRAPATTETVTIIVGEHVAARGRRSISWLLRDRNRWVPVQRCERAGVERLDAGPGTVWEARVTLNLPRGARLMRVESTPRRDARREPLEYLRREVRAAERTVHRTEYEVGPRGKLRRRRA